MTPQLLIFGILGLATIAVAIYVNRRLFAPGNGAGRVTPLEAVYYVVGVCSIVLGWYFNVRYTHTYHDANYVELHQDAVHQLGRRLGRPGLRHRERGADAALDDRRGDDGSGLKWAWIFFVMSLFTSLAFSIALFLAFMERQLRYNNALAQAPAVPSVPARRRPGPRSRSCSPG